MELFKKSFALYVESGMRKKIEAEIDIFGNQCGPMTKEFKAKFFKMILEHYLGMFHCFHLCLTLLTASPKFSSLNFGVGM